MDGTGVTEGVGDVWWAGYSLLFSVALECAWLRSVRVEVGIATIVISFVS